MKKDNQLPKHGLQDSPFPDLQVSGKLILLTQSASWPAAIARWDLPLKKIHAVDLQDLALEADTHFGSVAAIELQPGKIGQVCKIAANLANRPSQLRIIALGTPELVKWKPLVRLAGFAEAFWSTIEANRLPRILEAHIRSLTWPHRELEQLFESNLPWPR